MNTTDTLDIYAPGNEAAWERAVRDALDKVRPGMGEALTLRTGDLGAVSLVGRVPGENGMRVSATRQRSGSTGLYIHHGGYAGGWGGADPLTCWCLAWCELQKRRRAAEGVTT